MIHLFNPDHDLALANFDSNFTAPASARKLRSDLAMLPVWYAPDGAFVVAEGELNNSHLELLKEKLPIKTSLIPFLQLASLPPSEVQPWGWNPHLRKQLIQFGMNERLLPSQQDLELIRYYSDRQYAVKLLAELKRLNSNFCGESFYYTDIDKLLSYVYAAKGDQALKMPLSGSGKGIVWIKNAITDKQIDWCRRVINTQGGVVIEPVLNKVQDFAMEFEMSQTGIQFIGYSLFQSAASGAYMGNLLLPDTEIKNRLSTYVDRTLLKELKAILKTKLNEYFPHYRGYLGVDMMICKTSDSIYQLQPCVEMNVRMNMGIVAHRIYNRFVHPGSSGTYSIDFFKQKGEAETHNRNMETKYPPLIKDGKIKKGHLALTPVDTATQYVAHVSIKQNHEEKN